MELFDKLFGWLDKHGLSLVLNVVAFFYIYKIQVWITKLQEAHTTSISSLQEKRIEELKLIHKIISDVTASNEKLTQANTNIINKIEYLYEKYIQSKN